MTQADKVLLYSLADLARCGNVSLLELPLSVHFVIQKRRDPLLITAEFYPQFTSG